MTPTARTTPKSVSPTFALACAEDEFRDEAYAMYEGVTSQSVGYDLTELETVAEILRNAAMAVEVCLSRMEFAASGYKKHAMTDLILDALDDHFQHGGTAIVRANIAKMDARNQAQNQERAA